MVKARFETFPAGARLLFWVGQVCRQAREAANVSPTDVAFALGRDPQAVRDFELGNHVPRELDAMLALYGHLTGHDPRELVQDAVALWYENGSAPVLSSPDEAAGDRQMPTLPPAPQPREANGGRRTNRRKAS